MVSTTPAFSPVKNHNSHMVQRQMSELKPSVFDALDGAMRHPAEMVLMRDDQFRATKNVFPANQLPVNTVAGIKGERVFGFDSYEIPV